MVGGVVKPKVGPPRLLLINLENFQREIDWIKNHVLTNFGKQITNVRLEPYTERWMMYGEEGFIVAVEHEIVETLYGIHLMQAAKHEASKKSST